MHEFTVMRTPLLTGIDCVDVECTTVSKVFNCKPILDGTVSAEKRC